MAEGGVIMTTTKTKIPTLTVPPNDQPLKITNDNSNPQQGSTPTPLEGSPMRPQAETGPGRTNMMKNPPTKKDSRKLFVGGLPADVTESEFREFFEQFGEVLDSVVMFDRETQRSRGFGFVTFSDPEVAEMLLNTRQDDEAGATPAVSNDGQRVGRLVMRGKMCEVKAAEPKETSRSARRGYQNPGFGAAIPNRRFGDKTYGNPAAGERPISTHYLGAYHHDPHFMAGHHYPMMAPPYFPAYHHPGLYHHANGGYHPGLVYPPIGAVAGAVPGDGHQPLVPPQPVVPPLVAAHVDTMHAPYIDTIHHQEVGANYDYAGGQPPVHDNAMIHPSYPFHAGPHVNAKGRYYAGAFPVSAPSSSAMHPAAPGIPAKEDK